MVTNRRIVVNIPGTTGDQPPEGASSFRAWAHDQSGSERERCDVLGCPEPGTQGAHVVDLETGIAAIADLCSTHNHVTNTEPMMLKYTAALVPLPGELERFDALIAAMNREIRREENQLRRNREVTNAIGTGVLAIGGAAAGAAIAKHNNVDPVLGGLLGGLAGLLVSALASD